MPDLVGRTRALLFFLATVASLRHAGCAPRAGTQPGASSRISGPALASSHCRQFLEIGGCFAQDLSAFDPTLTPTGEEVRFLSSLKLHASRGGALLFEPSPSCKVGAEQRIRLGFSYLNVSLAKPLDAAATCTPALGTWFLASDQQHRQDSLFEDMITTLYPLYLLTRVACNLATKDIKITHIGGNHANFLAHPELYSALGSYVPWAVAVNRGVTLAGEPVAGCMTFQRAITSKTEFSWWDVPLAAQPNRQLRSFARFVVRSLKADAAQPKRCRRTLLLSLQPWESLNSQVLVKGLASALPSYDIEVQDVAAMPFSQALSAVRQADIFMFGPSSGVSPLSIFSVQGTVVLELIPLRRAAPLARNMAVMTNHIYLSWQQLRSGTANDEKADKAHGMEPGSVMVFDVPAVLDVVRAAAMVVAGNVVDNFQAADGISARQRADCPWCSDSEKHFDCLNSTLV